MVGMGIAERRSLNTQLRRRVGCVIDHEEKRGPFSREKLQTAARREKFQGQKGRKAEGLVSSGVLEW